MTFASDISRVMLGFSEGASLVGNVFGEAGEIFLGDMLEAAVVVNGGGDLDDDGCGVDFLGDFKVVQFA